MSSINSYMGERLTSRVVDLLSICQGLVRRVCFWAAIVIPFLWVSLLLRGAITTAEHVTLTGLVAANLLALVGGHGYRPDWDRREPGERDGSKS